MLQFMGCFLNEVLSASHSGGGDPPAGVVRVDGERRAAAAPLTLILTLGHGQVVAVLLGLVACRGPHRHQHHRPINLPPSSRLRFWAILAPDLDWKPSSAPLDDFSGAQFRHP